MSVHFTAEASGSTLAEIREETESLLVAFFGEAVEYHLRVTDESITVRDGMGKTTHAIRDYNATITVMA